jgi:hypothetical protein
MVCVQTEASRLYPTSTRRDFRRRAHRDGRFRTGLDRRARASVSIALDTVESDLFEIART